MSIVLDFTAKENEWGPYIAQRLVDYPSPKVAIHQNANFIPKGATTIIISEILYYSDRTTVYLGCFEGSQGAQQVAVKFGHSDNIWTEVCGYKHMSDLQGSTIPRLYGVFLGTTRSGGTITGMILERFGDAITDMFETLERELQANILNALTRVHQHGIVLGDFREPNVLVDEKNQVRFIDFEEIADEHECPSTYEFSVTKTTLSSKEEGTLCPFLSVIGSQMGFWIEEEVTIGKYKFPAELFPPQDVINALLPERLLNSYTTPCVESLLGVYYGIVQERMDKGAELDELEPEQEQMMREAEERWKIRFPWLQSPRLRPHRKPSTPLPSP